MIGRSLLLALPCLCMHIYATSPSGSHEASEVMGKKAAGRASIIRKHDTNVQIGVNPSGGLTRGDEPANDKKKKTHAANERLAEDAANEDEDDAEDEAHEDEDLLEDEAHEEAAQTHMDSSLTRKGPSTPKPTLAECADIKVEKMCSKGYISASSRTGDMCTKMIWLMVHKADIKCAKIGDKCVQHKGGSLRRRRRSTAYTFKICTSRGNNGSCRRRESSGFSQIPLVCTRETR